MGLSLESCLEKRMPVGWTLVVYKLSLFAYSIESRTETGESAG